MRTCWLCHGHKAGDIFGLAEAHRGVLRGGITVYEGLSRGMCERGRRGSRQGWWHEPGLVTRGKRLSLQPKC